MKSLILSGFCFFWTGSVIAQQYTFINYSTENGLAQSQVSAMVQDKKGYLWFATLGGLSRFDGLEFKNFTRNDGLYENQLYSIYLDSVSGEMWIGSVGGYSVYNGIDFVSTSLMKEVSNYNISSINKDREGNVWFGLEGGGLVRMKDGHQQLYNEKQGLDPNVRTVFIDHSGKIWIGTKAALYLFENNKFVQIAMDGYYDNNVSCINEDRDGHLWVGTYVYGVYRADEEGRFYNFTSEDGLINDGVRTIFIDHHNNVWFGTKTGVSKYNGKNFKSFSVEQGLIHNNIKFISEDSEGNIWFGTDGKGVLKLAGEAFTTYSTADGLSSDLIMSVAEDQDHVLWFATYGEGVVSYDGTHYRKLNDQNGLANNTVWSIAVDRQNRKWFGTSNGLSVWDGKKMKNYFTEQNLLSNKITSLYADKDGSLWIGNKDGLSHLTDNVFVNYSEKEGLYGGNIRSIFKDQQNNFWLGGYAGLIRFDGKQFKLFRYDATNPDNTVYCINQNKSGNLWIGTKNGLYLFRNEAFIRVPIGESVNANTINFLIFQQEHLWIGTNNGIYNLNAERFASDGITELKNYSRLEGVRGLESNMNAAFRDSHGNYWFGTDGGLIHYDPSRANTNANTVEPYIQITDIRLFFEPIKWKNYSKNIDPETGFAKDLKVQYNKNHFTFYFTGISHTNPNKVKYKFILDGFDQSWSPETDARFTTYSNLPPGDYTFKVIACNDSGVWSSAPAQFSFTITKPFWLTWWFFAFCGFVFVSVVILIYRWRIAVIRRNTEREQLIYKSKLLSLEQQSLNASMNRHFIFNALNSIQYYINKQDKLEANRYLTSFAKLIRKNLDSSVSHNLVSLSEELERLELYLSLENMRFKNKFNYEIFIDEEIDTEGVKIPPMMLQPYVENSIWHGILPMDHPGTIWIKIMPEGSKAVRITIRDNGIGILTSMKAKNDVSDGHISRGIDINSGRLAILKKLTNENLFIEGPHEIYDNNRQVAGTEVVLVIPQVALPMDESFSEKGYE